jgi:hypothetical protein
VALTIGATTLGTVFADTGTGAWLFSLTPGQTSDIRVTLTATDAARNVSPGCRSAWSLAPAAAMLARQHYR